MKPPPELLHEENGAVSPSSLAVLLILGLSILFFRPVPETETHLRDVLGPAVAVQRF